MAARLQISEVDLAEPLLDCEDRLKRELRRQYLHLALTRVWGCIADTARVLGRQPPQRHPLGQRAGHRSRGLLSARTSGTAGRTTPGSPAAGR
jgi:hypothetical protein